MKCKEHYHIVGVAGVGMSALAQVLIARGYDVTGSDRYADQGRDLEILHKLSRVGVRLVPQDGSAVTKNTAAVVVSTAIEKDNPDLLAAQNALVPVVHRAAMLAKLIGKANCIAVAGTSGKTTVTAMIGWLLEKAGLDPFVVNGGSVVGWDTGDGVGNVRIGSGDLWVVEADESDRSFLSFSPDWAVITNLTHDHFDMPETVALFQHFVQRVKRGVVCGSGVSALLKETIARDVTLTALAPPVYENACDLYEKRGEWAFRIHNNECKVPLLGRHNAENALLAVQLCQQLKLPIEELANALTTFKGVRRRLERVGDSCGITVIDDYAHNPAKIAATWSALLPASQRIIGIWRPHGYAPLASMGDALLETFRGLMRSEDRLFILPVYYSGGTAHRKMHSEDFVANLRKARIKATYVPDYQSLLKRLLSLAKAGDTVLFAGARDPDMSIWAAKTAQAFKDNQQG